jgi:uncharacterized protein YndB with AHSA1/START domain
MNNTQQQTETLAPIVKSVLVSLPVDEAFRLFTAGISQWWPLASHSVGGDEAISCTIEGKVGGRVYETQMDKSQSEWGRVLAWEPPRRLAFTFYPGRTPADSTEVEVTFQAEPGGTRLTLIHRGWEHCGETIQAERPGYDRGWEYVLGKYEAATYQAGS